MKKDMQDNFEARNPPREEPENPEHTQGNAEDPDNSSEEERNPMILRNELPPRKSHIEYKVKKEDSWQEAIVINRAGKTTGRNKFWMNIKRVPQEEMKSLNFEELHEWRIKNESVLMSRSERHDVLEAKQKELRNWIDHDIYEEVKDKGQNCISVTWVITEKTSDGKQIVKARLVARGYEEENKDSLRTDSPTISKDNL